MDKFIMSSSPHVRSPESTRRIMLDVIIALLPATAFGIYFFGTNALYTVLLCVTAAMATEALLQLLMKRQITAFDGSAAVTGLLLALNLPPAVPWWIPVIGAVFAIAIVKIAFGGLGHNFLNPALAARAFLVISWTSIMTTWSLPADAVTSATPLDALKQTGVYGATYMDMFIGRVGGCIGETSAAALLAGAAYLLIRKVINWRIPIVYIGTVALFAWAAGRDGLFTGDALYHVLAGGLILGAFYMATDYTTSPMTNRGKVIFAAGCGVLTGVIRLWGGYPEGVSYSILLMNLVVPLLDRKFMPRVFGGAAK